SDPSPSTMRGVEEIALQLLNPLSGRLPDQSTARKFGSCEGVFMMPAIRHEDLLDCLRKMVLRQNSWVNSGNSVPPFPRGKRELFPRSSAGICVSNCFPERGCHPAGLGIGLSWPKHPFSRGPNRMHLKTLLNRVEPHQSFVYGEVRFCNADRSALEVVIRERANGRPICS